MAPARAVGGLVRRTPRSASARRAASQRAFLRNLARGEAYQAEAPTLWDVTFRTAVAQAELEDRERPGAYHRMRSPARTGPVQIDTTRPELLPACVALVAHPDDERYRRWSARRCARRCSASRCRCVAHRLADPDKGTGIAMVCTFGDLTDVTWWRELDLPTRAVIGRDGRLLAEPPAGVPGRRPTHELAGQTVQRRSSRIVELLREAGDLRRRAATDHPPGEVLREGRPAAGDRHDPAVVHPQRWPRRRAAGGAAGPRATSSTGYPSTCGTATRTGWVG